MGNIRAVLFDKDGTLLPFDPFWTNWTKTFGSALSVMLRRQGVRPTESEIIDGMLDWPANTRTASHGSSLDVATMTVLYQRIIQYLVSCGVPTYRARAAVGRAVLTADDVAAAVPIGPYPQVLEALTGLADDGIKLGVVTGDNVARARHQIGALGLGSLVSVVIGGDCGLNGKPDPATLQAAVTQLDTDPAHAMYVGDSLVDVRAARATGFARAIVYSPTDAIALPAWSDEADGVLRNFAFVAEFLHESVTPNPQ